MVFNIVLEIVRIINHSFCTVHIQILIYDSQNYLQKPVGSVFFIGSHRAIGTKRYQHFADTGYPAIGNDN